MSSAQPHPRDLPDRLIVRLVRELPPHKRELGEREALWEEREAGELGPELSTDLACGLLRNAPRLRQLRVRDRSDADALLLEVARCCKSLERLELERCRGSLSFAGVASLPLLKLAQGCPRLQRLQFTRTHFRCSRVFKVWAELRGPDEPCLHVAVNKLYPEQAKFLERVLGAPQELRQVALESTPTVLRVQNHSVSLLQDCNPEAPTPSTSTPSPDSAPAPTRVIRPAPSFHEDEGCSPGGKRQCRRDSAEQGAHTDLSPRSPTTSCTERPAAYLDQAPSCFSSDDESTAGTGGCWEVTAEHSDEDNDDDGDVVTAPRSEYRSLFSMSGLTAAHPVLGSWFTRGYIGPVPGVTPSQSDEDVRHQEAAGPSRRDSDLSLHVEEEGVLESLTARRGSPPPPAALRTADNLLEPAEEAVRDHWDS